MGNYGFLDLAVNASELWEEIETIIKLVKSFNESRTKVISFKDTILSHQINSSNRFSTRKIQFPKSCVQTDLKRLSTPNYNDKTFERISIKAFLSDHIRKVLSIWENDKSQSIKSNNEVELVLDYIRMEFPRLRYWNSKKILYRISKNWDNRTIIQNNINTVSYTHLTLPTICSV